MNEPEVAPPKVVGTGEVVMARAQPKLLPELVSRLKGVLERFTTGSVPISKTWPTWPKAYDTVAGMVELVRARFTG